MMVERDVNLCVCVAYCEINITVETRQLCGQYRDMLFGTQERMRSHSSQQLVFVILFHSENRILCIQFDNNG